MPFSFILLVYINIEKFSHHNTLVSSIVMSRDFHFVSCRGRMCPLFAILFGMGRSTLAHLFSMVVLGSNLIVHAVGEYLTCILCFFATVRRTVYRRCTALYVKLRCSFLFNKRLLFNYFCCLFYGSSPKRRMSSGGELEAPRNAG